jgi:hypothetical protein
MLVFDKIKKILRNSSRVHLRDTEVSSLSQVLEVIDRFIDGNPRRPLEWDDFVSWDNSNSGVEKVRQRIAALEGEFFSKSADERWEAHVKLVGIRNEIAALTGVRSRDVGNRKTG